MKMQSADPASSQRASFLDSYRGIACLLVCFCHAGFNLNILQFTLWGFTGVHLFFVISGYLIFQPFLKAMLAAKPMPSTALYYQTRFVRIMPPYLAALIVFIGLRVVTHTKIPTFANILTHITLSFNYFSDKDFYSINPVLWTLAIEAQFYLILPLVVYIAYRFRKPTGVSSNKAVIGLLAALFLGGIAARGLEFSHLAHGHAAHTPQINFRSIFSFLEKSGVLNKMIQRIPPFVPLYVGTILIVAANFWCSLASPGGWLESNSLLYTLFFPPLICMGFGLFLLTNILYKQTQKNILNTSPLVTVGLISYSVYLYHVGVQFIVFNHLHLGHYISNWSLLNLINGLIALPFVLLISALMYFLVEKPSIDWLRRKKEARLPQREIVLSA